MTDRDQVAREVLTEMLNYDMARVETIRDVQQFMNEHYPAPPAPETVTVDGVTYTNDCEGTWYDASGYTMASWVCKFLTRIASDACVLKDRDARIAELERENASLKAETDRISELRQDAIDELVRVGRERDEARRAAESLDVRNKGLLLELVQSATSQVDTRWRNERDDAHAGQNMGEAPRLLHGD